MNQRLRNSVSQIITLLVAGKYLELETLTRHVRLSANEIAATVSDYGRQLILPPDSGFELMDVVEVKDANPKRWSVRMPLWTREEGRSDLTLEMTVIDKQNGFVVELDDIHVL